MSKLKFMKEIVTSKMKEFGINFITSIHFSLIFEDIKKHSELFRFSEYIHPDSKSEDDQLFFKTVIDINDNHLASIDSLKLKKFADSIYRGSFIYSFNLAKHSQLSYIEKEFYFRFFKENKKRPLNAPIFLFSNDLFQTFILEKLLQSNSSIISVLLFDNQGNHIKTTQHQDLIYADFCHYQVCIVMKTIAFGYDNTENYHLGLFKNENTSSDILNNSLIKHFKSTKDIEKTPTMLISNDKLKKYFKDKDVYDIIYLSLLNKSSYLEPLFNNQNFNKNHRYYIDRIASVLEEEIPIINFDKKEREDLFYSYDGEFESLNYNKSYFGD